MSFLDFASTLREQAAVKAKEAAQKLQTSLPASLPNFDDMAANDEYIHSEDYNVRGEPKQWKKDEQQKLLQVQQQQRSGNFSDDVDGDNAFKSSASSPSSTGAPSVSSHVPETVSMSLGFGGDEASACTTESSWSLLDRVAGGGTTTRDAGTTNFGNTSRFDQPTSGNSGWSYHEVQEGSSSMQRQENSSVAARTDIYSTESTASLKKGRRSPTPLLSVVAHTLQGTPNRSNTATSHLDARHDIGMTSQSVKSKSFRNQHYMHDENDEDYDDDDPIFSMLRKESTAAAGFGASSEPSPAPPMSSHRSDDMNTTSNRNTRFMDDLEKRMNAAEDVSSLLIVNTDTDGERNEALQYSFLSTPTAARGSGSNGPFTKGPFGGYFLNLAVSSANKILNRADNTNVNTSAGTIKSPPLARAKRMKSNIDDNDDVQYHVTSSTSVLADEDMARLKQLKESADVNNYSIGMLYDNLYSNRRFVFIFCTFILSLIVYWYLSQTVRSEMN